VKIIHIYKTFYPHSFGGIEKCIDTLCANLIEQQIESEVISTAPIEETITDNNSAYKKTYYPTTINKFSCPISLPLLKDFKKRTETCNLIHFHFPWPFADLVQLCASIKKPYIVTYHSDIVRQKITKLFYSPLMYYFLSHAEKIVATSDQYVQSSAVLQRFKKNTTVIPIGLVDHYQLPAENRKNQKPYFLFLGVLRQYKGLRYLIEAMRGVENYELVIAGDGPCYTNLKELASSLQLKNIKWIQKVDEAKKWSLYRDAYGVISSADMRNEAYCYMLVEGLMFGKPLISTELQTGTSFVNQDQKTGIVVPPKNALALRNAMQKLFHNKQLAGEYGYNSRNRFIALFQADTMAQKYLQLYKQVIKG